MKPDAERRKSWRAGCESSLEYTLSIVDFNEVRRVHSTGEAIDISEAGLGFLTEFPLKPGHILILRMAGDDRSCAAIVRWVDGEEPKIRVGALLCT